MTRPEDCVKLMATLLIPTYTFKDLRKIQCSDSMLLKIEKTCFTSTLL